MSEENKEVKAEEVMAKEAGTEKKEKKKMSGKVIALIVAIVLAACAGGGYAYYNHKIQTMQDEAVASMGELINPDDYRDAEKKEISKIMEETEKKIRETKEEEEMQALLNDASDSFSKLKTNAQYEAEEEAARQAELERQRQEEAERRAAEEAAAAAARAKAKKAKKKSSGGSGGCVGGGSDVYY